MGVSACHTTQVGAQQRQLRFTSEQLTQHLRRALPSEQCVFGTLACVHLQNPRVSMKPNDQRLFVDFDARFTTQGESVGEGAASVAGIPRYDPAKGAFFISKPALLKLELPGMPAYQSSIAAQIVSEMLADDISQQPVWTLDDKDPQQALARLTLRGVKVENGKLVLTIGDEEQLLDNPTEPETTTPKSTPEPKSTPGTKPKEQPPASPAWPPKTIKL